MARANSASDSAAVGMFAEFKTLLKTDQSQPQTWLVGLF